MRYSAPVILTALLLSAALPADTLRCAPKEGTKLGKVFESSAKLKITAEKLTIDGEGSDDAESESSGTYEDTSDVRIVDTYGKVEDGRPREIVRKFEHVRSKSTAPDEEDQDHTSKLEDTTVVFAWNEKTEEWKKSFRDGGDKDLLEHLDEDMDLHSLLPDHAVKEEDHWTIEAKDFATVLYPGGQLALEPDQIEADLAVCANLHGKVEAVHKGLKTVDGHELAVIKITADLESGAETKEELGLMHIKLHFRLEGELRWDVAGRHLHDLKLEGTQTVGMRTEASFTEEDKSHTVVQELTLEGPTTFGVHLDDELTR